MDLGTEFIVMDLHTASNLGMEDIVEQMLSDSHYFVDDKNAAGWTPLMYACWSSHERVVDLLLRAGASLTTSNSAGQTPLILAVITGNINIVKQTLKEGILNIQDNLGKTALYHAVEYCYLPLVCYLLIQGANANIRTIHGSSALMVAAEKGQLYLVELLLDYGAQKDQSAQDFMGLQQANAPIPYEAIPNDSMATSSKDGAEVRNLLESLSLGKYWPIFESKHVDIHRFLQLTEDDLKSLGIKLLGPRRKIYMAIKSFSK